MYERVVVPYDGSARSLAALRPARRLAAAWGCSVEMLHVRAREDEEPPALDAGPSIGSVVADDPVPVLLDAAADAGTLVCMSTRGRGAVGEVVLGSVARSVLRDAGAPMVLVGPEVLDEPGTTGLERILVCLDGSATSAVILPVVRRWALALRLEVVLLHVAYPLAEEIPGLGSASEEARVMPAELQRTVDELSAAGVAARSLLVEHTDAAAGIAQQAGYRRCDLIAIVPQGRSAVERVVMGSVARDVVRSATVPVLALHPRRLT